MEAEDGSFSAAAAMVARQFAAGIAAGVAETAVGHPLETLKTRMQVALGTGQSEGLFSLLGRAVREDGAASLYRGAGPRILAGGVGGSVLFGVNGALREALDADASRPYSWRFMLAAAGTGVAEGFVYAPLEILKLQAMAHTGASAPPSFAALAVQLARERGISALYRGLSATIMRESMGNMAYFSTYASLKTAMLHARGEGDGPHHHHARTWEVVVAGGLAGSAYWLVVQPVDIVKTLQQTDDAADPRFSSMVSCARHIVRQRGWAGLYLGIGPSLLRAFPSSSAAFLAYEWAMELMRPKGREERHPL